MNTASIDLNISSAGTLLGRKEFAFAKDSARYDEVWEAATERCRHFPQDNFLHSLLLMAK